jgi:hypothetical protein
MVPEDQLRVIFAILTSLPFSFILKKLPSETWRKYFSLIIASLLQYYVYRNEIALSFSMHLLIYTAIRIKGRREAGLQIAGQTETSKITREFSI